MSSVTAVSVTDTRRILALHLVVSILSQIFKGELLDF